MSKNIFEKKIIFIKVGLNDKAAFFRDLGIMLNSGFSITEALSLMTKQGPKKLRGVVKNILEKIEVGSTFSEAIKVHDSIFSTFHVNILRAGEASGTLEESFGNLSEELLKQGALREKIRTAMFYPGIVLVLSFFLAFGMTYFVLPNLTKIFVGMDIALPLSTRFLIWFTAVTQEHGFLILCFLVLFIVLGNYLLKRDFVKPVLHKIFLKIPIVKDIVKYKNLTDLSRTMSLLLKSGLSFFDAIETTKKIVGNYYYKKVLIEAELKVNEGMKLSDVLARHEHLFPGMAVGMISIGERSGKLVEQFTRLGDLYEFEVSKRVSKISIAIEPILLIFIGLVVGGLAMSIITPIYKITGSIGY